MNSRTVSGAALSRFAALARTACGGGGGGGTDTTKPTVSLSGLPCC